MAILELKSVTRSFGGLAAVQSASLELHAGERVGLIGPNGAGKTTLFNLISGVYRPDSGDIVLRGESLVGLPPHEIALRGVTRTFQNIRLFGGMTVLDNVKAAQHHRARSGLLASMVRTRSFEREESAMERASLELLREVGLADRRDALPGELPYGAQRRLEIARALAGGPQVLLLDEPAAGMNRAGDGRADGPHPPPAARARALDPAHRAPDGARDGHLPADLRAGFRRGDRPWHAR